MALADDPEHLGIDGLRRLFAEWLFAAETACAPQVRILARGELHHAERSLIPQRVTMRRARLVACSISFSAPVVRVP